MFFELFERGGPVMWPLVCASVLGLALILERSIVFLWWSQRFGPVVAALEPLVTKGAWTSAEEWCQRRRRGPYTRLALVYFRLRDRPLAKREHILTREATLLLGSFERRLRWLATLAQVSTLLGLLGTFYFMIYRFRPEVTASGQVPQAEFFAAIWESFLSTMFGLIIAIPCTAAYHIFEGRVDVVARCLEALVSYLDEWRDDIGGHLPAADQHRATAAPSPKSSA